MHKLQNIKCYNSSRITRNLPYTCLKQLICITVNTFMSQTIQNLQHKHKFSTKSSQCKPN